MVTNADKCSNKQILSTKNILNHILGLRPKRTLRMVLWTGEEQGGVGAEQYYQLHKVSSVFR